MYIYITHWPINILFYCQTFMSHFRWKTNQPSRSNFPNSRSVYYCCNYCSVICLSIIIIIIFLSSHWRWSHYKKVLLSLRRGFLQQKLRWKQRINKPKKKKEEQKKNLFWLPRWKGRGGMLNNREHTINVLQLIFCSKNKNTLEHSNSFLFLLAFWLLLDAY